MPTRLRKNKDTMIRGQVQETSWSLELLEMKHMMMSMSKTFCSKNLKMSSHTKRENLLWRKEQLNVKKCAGTKLKRDLSTGKLMKAWMNQLCRESNQRRSHKREKVHSNTNMKTRKKIIQSKRRSIGDTAQCQRLTPLDMRIITMTTMKKKRSL